MGTKLQLFFHICKQNVKKIEFEQFAPRYQSIGFPRDEAKVLASLRVSILPTSIIR